MTPIIFKVIDWDESLWKIDFQKAKFTECEEESDYDLIINSQPLHYAFNLPFGIQTLGVSGRYRFNSKIDEIPSSWSLLRIITSLDNAGIKLSFKGLFNFSTIRWVWSRREGLFSQIYQQYLRFFQKRKPIHSEL